MLKVLTMAQPRAWQSGGSSLDTLCSYIHVEGRIKSQMNLCFMYSRIQRGTGERKRSLAREGLFKDKVIEELPVREENAPPAYADIDDFYYLIVER